MDRYKITFDTWNKVADLYQEQFMDFDLYDDSYDFFCEQIQKLNPEILEIGCGPGNITRYLLSKRPDFKIEAIDVAPNMIKAAQENNPTTTFKVMDCRAIDTLERRFDAVICGFCMPYLSKEDCAKLIKDSSGLLENGGLIYFSTIEGNYQVSGFQSGSTGDQTYVYYHEANRLQQELEKNHFASIEIRRKTFARSNGQEEVHLIFIAKKK